MGTLVYASGEAEERTAVEWSDAKEEPKPLLVTGIQEPLSNGDRIQVEVEVVGVGRLGLGSSSCILGSCDSLIAPMGAPADKSPL